VTVTSIGDSFTFINQSPFLQGVSYDFVSATAQTVLNDFPTRPISRER
jgi:hypothetical protein